MKLFITSSLLFIAIHLPSLSFGVKCWQCKSYRSILLGGGCSYDEAPMHIEEDCGNNNCVEESFFKNYSIYRLGCDSSFHLHKDVWCHKVGHIVGQPKGPAKSANLRQCTCGTDLCNKPDTKRTQCFSCYGNRNRENEDDPIDLGSTAPVTDFVCKKDEKQTAIHCPLDAPVCMIKWDKEQRTIGCGSFEIPKGKISECSGYYFSGVGECYCNTNLCNTENLKELLPKTTTSTEPIESESESSVNEETETDSKSKSTFEDLNLVIAIVVVIVLVVIVAMCALAAILILRQKNNPIQYALQ